MSIERNGFTLVEVLVALVATSLLLAAVMNGAVSARERDQGVRDRREAVALARDLIARGAAAPFQPGRRSGREGDLDWSLDEEPAAADPRGGFVLSRLSISIGRGSRRLFEGETRRLKSIRTGR